MNHLKLYTSNRLEILADKLAEVLSTPLASPFDAEIIVVQSKGMERWISMELARRLGISANIRFPFPNAFVYEIMARVIPNISEPSPFDVLTMTWNIMNLLPTFIDDPEFKCIRKYLDQPGATLKGYQLAERIADTFDQYLLYRPELILRWEHGKEDHWQAILWKKLIQGNEHQHRVALGKAFFEIMQQQPESITGFPERVQVFGISALPRFHIQIFAAMSRFTEVNLFIMNPCREYWGDILTNREIKQLTNKFDRQNLDPELFYLEKGNSLLSSMGTLGRDFFDILEEFNPEKIELFVEPGSTSLLTRIQSDILTLYNREKSSQKEKISATDVSIQIHSCHSPMREVEVLQDQLLNMFEQMPGLTPRDILVMTPDIESYAPYIQAVFDLPEHDPRRIPFAITDKNYRLESRIIETFMAILELTGSRLGVAQVLSILESPAVKNKFDLTETDLDIINNWVRDTRIRWGSDSTSRTQMGLPEFPDNTWKVGLDRLLLGYAMPGYDEQLFAGILPYDHIEGTETEILGKFIEFIKQLFYQVNSLTEPRTLKNWSETLRTILNTFLLPDEDDEDEIQVIREALNRLEDQQIRTNYNEKVDILIIKHYLEQQFEKEKTGVGFLTGGITFCAMLPMRSIPAKVICLIGLNDDAYPRQSKPVGFDLITKNPRPGDRSKRTDDRYLFLESILSARERLIISYVGQSIQDNSSIQPSVLVSELVDYIEQGFEILGKNIRDHLIIKHRLQAFNPEYFQNDSKLFSYSNDNYLTAKRLQEPSLTPAPFISQGISTPDQKWKTISLTELCRFFANPAKFLLNKRLGIFLEESESVLEERESFNVYGLDRYTLEQNLVARKLTGQDLSQFFLTIKATGALPPGTVGQCVYEKVSTGIEHFVEQTTPYIRGKLLPPLEVDLTISDFNLIGRLEGIYTDHMLQFRYARIKARDRLKLWLQHLVLNRINAENYPHTSLLIALDPTWSAWEYVPVTNSEDILHNLLQIYWQGLIKPLPFFPETSWEYAHRLLERNQAPDKAMINARQRWQGTSFSYGESEDLYFQLCVKDSDPINSFFKELSLIIFKPLIEHQTKIEK